MDLRPGDTVFGIDSNQSYVIEEYIDSGAFGLVYKIKSTPDGASFALKTIVTGSLNPSQLEALMNEGRLATTIDHPNVLRYIFSTMGTSIRIYRLI